MSLPEIYESVQWFSTISAEVRNAFVAGVILTLILVPFGYKALKRFFPPQPPVEEKDSSGDWSALEKKINGWIQSPQVSLWYVAAPNPVPLFVQPANRRTRIVSVFNLKGGVGKTTVTANLAATLSRRENPPRILLIDADWQASLTAICAENNNATINTLWQERKVLQRIIKEGPPLNLFDVTHQVNNQHLPNTRLLGANGDLSQIEDATLIGWAVGLLKDDPRFLLRRWLHSSEITNNFDLILIDCPPRLTTASVAALVASDELLIPVIPDALSADAVVILLRNLQSARHIAPLTTVRIIPNQVRWQGQHFIQNHNIILNSLSVDAQKVWGGGASVN